MVNWRIYYADYSTFDSSQGEPQDAPGTRAVLILMQHHDPREQAYFQWMKDYYVWKNGRWYAVDYGALMFYWFTEKYDHPRASLAGETVSNPDWNLIRERAKADKDFFSG